MVFVTDALGGWLVGKLADAGRKKLTELVFGSEQERVLRQAADVAVWATADDVSPTGGEQAEQVAMVISEVFRDPVPDAPSAGPVMLLEGLRAGIAGQLAVLDDAGLTGTRQSSADVLGVPGAVLAERLTGHLVREIIVRGSGGGPLAPLADQFNHELTRLQGQRIEGMLARLATEVRDALARPGSGVTVAGRPLEEVTDPFLLEVHRPVEPDVPQPGLPVLPVYVPRDHDAALAEVVSAAAAETSGIALLVGGSSTGKTRACWQALERLRGLEPGWRLWHPIDPQGALAGLPGVGSRTVVWLNEAQRCLNPADGTGERVAAGLRELLRDRDRGPVLVLATLWPDYWAELSARPSEGADPHAQARELLAGHNIPVSPTFTGEQLQQLDEAGDPRLVQAAAGSRDGQVIQYLAGGPELLDRYRNAPPAARELIHAAMDARRLGMGPALPRAFLATAAPGYLTDTQWNLLPDNWLEEGLAYTKERAKGAPGPLTPIRPRPFPGAPATLGDEQAWQLSDYLDQHGRRTRREEIPPAAFWAAAVSHADPPDLTGLGNAAEDRGLYRDAARLYKQASGYGNPVAGVHLVKLLRTLDPGDQRPADWALAHASLDDPADVAQLLGALPVGATGQVTTLLDRDPAAHASLHDPNGVADLVRSLRRWGATDQAAALADRAVAHARVDDPYAVAVLLDLLSWPGPGARGLAALADRAATHASLDNPGAVNALLGTLLWAGTTSQVTTLADRAATYVSLDNPRAVTDLLATLQRAEATSQAAALADRFTAHATALADRAVADVRLDDPPAVAALLNVLRQAGATGQVTTLLGRDPAAHARLDDPGDVARLLEALRKMGATGQVDALLDRDPAAHARLDDPEGVTVLLGALRDAGATGQVDALLDRDPAAHARLDDPEGVTVLLGALRDAGATGQVTTLASRAAAHGSLEVILARESAVTRLLGALREAGASAQAAELIERLPAAGLFELFCKQEDRGEKFRFGRETDSRPAKRWTWTDLG